MNLPADLKYAASHEWVRVQGDVATVGITDHAQSELTDIVYLELPDTGRTVNAGEEVGVIESVKSANDLYAPVSGEIVEVNQPLVDEPGAVNSDPYGEGWMYRVRLDDAGREALEGLMDAAAYGASLS